MATTLQDLHRLFYPMSDAEQRRWAEIVALPEQEYLTALEVEGRKLGLTQDAFPGGVAWSNERSELVLLFRILDPTKLEAVRDIYDSIAKRGTQLAYVFVHQLPDGEGTWDIFHMSPLTYLAHCNRISGPGSETRI
jgi:hypothetical protein